MDGPDIQRINGYEDPRFSPLALRQHGSFLVNGEPYEVEIADGESGIIRGADAGYFPAVIEAFRFYTPHISRFLNEKGDLVAQFPAPPRFWVALEDIQPSQFYVDLEKAAALRGLIHTGEDVVIQVMRDGERYISLDGHTRLYLALEKGLGRVLAVEAEVHESIWDFVREAQRRGIRMPRDLIPLSHEEYVEKWNKYCDDYFAGRVADQEKEDG